MHDFSQDKHTSNINNKEIFSNTQDMQTVDVFQDKDLNFDLLFMGL